MGATVKVQVKKPDGTPVAGAKILAINHDAWLAKHRDWNGTTTTAGEYVWPNMDTGTLGDRYTFTASFQEDGGPRWSGESSHRIRGKGDQTVTITVNKDGNGTAESEPVAATP